MGEPRPASTVILLRSRAEAAEPFDLFLVKRHGKSGFMANAYVFPGGRVDARDADPPLLARLEGVDGDDLAASMNGVTTSEVALAHVVAGIRETFEEAGVLLARDRHGALVAFAEGPARARFGAWRARLNGGEVTFAELVEREDLVLAGDALTYCAHWITPVREGKRYDTRFFVAHAPEAQEYAHDAVETTDSRWRSPAAALAEYAAGEVFLAPPTWTILGELATRHADAAAAIAWARGLRTPETIEPHITHEGGELVLALPGDPLHPDTDGASPNAAERRIVLKRGRWSMTP